jgi:hypothetical protein
MLNASAATTLAGSSPRLATSTPASDTSGAGGEGLRGWFAVLGADDPALHSYLLALRFLVANLIAYRPSVKRTAAGPSQGSIIDALY